MGKAEEFFAARNQRTHAQIQASFERDRAELFAKIDKELEGFAELAERVQFENARPVSDYGGPHRSASASTPRVVTYGWELTSYDSEGGTRSHNSYITASNGDLYVNNWHYNDPAKKNMCAQTPDCLWGMKEVLNALQRLRHELERG